MDVPDLPLHDEPQVGRELAHQRLPERLSPLLHTSMRQVRQLGRVILAVDEASRILCSENVAGVPNARGFLSTTTCT